MSKKTNSSRYSRMARNRSENASCSDGDRNARTLRCGPRYGIRTGIHRGILAPWDGRMGTIPESEWKRGEGSSHYLGKVSRKFSCRDTRFENVVELRVVLFELTVFAPEGPYKNAQRVKRRFTLLHAASLKKRKRSTACCESFYHP